MIRLHARLLILEQDEMETIGLLYFVAADIEVRTVTFRCLHHWQASLLCPVRQSVWAF